MKILGTEYNLKHRSLEIYLSGCKSPHCENCHNPESWNFNNGKDLDIEKLHTKIKDFDSLIDNIWVLGGEPLDQDLNRLIELINSFKQFNKKIWLWTKYDISDLDAQILNILDYIKTGMYKYELDGYMTDFDIYLSSNNQKIIKLK